MIKQFLNSVIAKYRVLSASRSQLFSLAFDILLNLVQYLLNISRKYPYFARGLYVFPPKTKRMPTAETFILQKLPEATLKNTIKPKFQLPFGLLESQSCKSDTKRNKTDYNRQICLSRAAKTNQLIRVEMDLHFKTASLPKSREKRSTDVLPFSLGFR